MIVFKRIKKAVNDFLEKLAKENEKAFGNTVPDCCKLNRQGSNSKKA